jgi:hypothetical protein
MDRSGLSEAGKAHLEYEKTYYSYKEQHLNSGIENTSMSASFP